MEAGEGQGDGDITKNGPPKEIRAHLVDGVAVLDAPGELDLSRAEEMRSARLEALGLGAPLVVNLSDCEFIDSTGIGMLIATCQEAGEAGHAFALAGSGPQVQHVLELVGVSAVVPYFSSLAAAMEHVKGRED